jgi:hypothetical protein
MPRLPIAREATTQNDQGQITRCVLALAFGFIFSVSLPPYSD